MAARLALRSQSQAVQPATEKESGVTGQVSFFDFFLEKGPGTVPETEPRPPPSRGRPVGAGQEVPLRAALSVVCPSVSRQLSCCRW